MKCFLVVLCLLFNVSLSYGQKQICGTFSNSLNVLKRKGSNAARTQSLSCYTIQLSIHIVRNSVGGDGQNPAIVIPQVMQSLQSFTPHGIYFTLVNSSEVWNDDYMTDLDLIKYKNLIQEQRTPNAINIYIVSDDCGWNQGLAEDVPGETVVIGGTFPSLYGNLIPAFIPHEVGHCLGLYHTMESMFGQELINGSNCATAGDLVCDTPAEDPTCTFNASASCTPIRTCVDANQQAYQPDLQNHMAYVRASCNQHFTTGQGDRMRDVIENTPSVKAMTTSDLSGLALTGSTLFCDTSPLYTVTGAPAGSTITWQALPAGIVSISSQNATQAAVTRITNGTFTLTANVSTPCAQGSASLPNIVIGPEVYVGTVGGVYFSSSLGPYSSLLMWPSWIQENSVPNGTITVEMDQVFGVPYSFSTDPSGDFPLSQVGPYTASFDIDGYSRFTSRVTLLATKMTPCGPYTVPFVFVDHSYGYGYRYAYSPNPANQTLVVEAQADESTAKSKNISSQFEALLYNSYGELVRSGQSQQGKVFLDVSNLPAGMYNLRAGTGKNALSKHIQVNHEAGF